MHFCRSCIEGSNHLFFYCSFCRRVWFGNLRRCLIVDLPYKWEDIVERGVKEWKGIGLKADLIKLVLSASVYNLWRERNNIRHGNPLQTEEKIIQRISWEVEVESCPKGII